MTVESERFRRLPEHVARRESELGRELGGLDLGAVAARAADRDRARVRAAAGDDHQAALVLAVEIQVKAVEEPYLERTHGDAYRRYRAHSWRFVPGVGR